MELNRFKQKLKRVLRNQFLRGGNVISYVEAKDMLRKTSRAILIDVRSIQEYKEYHLDGAICIPSFELQDKISEIIANKDQIIIVYCQSGTRSKKAANILRKMGYTNVYEVNRRN